MPPGFWFGVVFAAIGGALHWMSGHKYNTRTGDTISPFTRGKYQGAAYTCFAFGGLFGLPNLIYFLYITFFKH